MSLALSAFLSSAAANIAPRPMLIPTASSRAAFITLSLLLPRQFDRAALRVGNAQGRRVELVDGDLLRLILIAYLAGDAEFVAVKLVGSLVRRLLAVALELDVNLAVLGEFDQGALGRALVLGLGHFPLADDQLGVVSFLLVGPREGGDEGNDRSDRHQSNRVHGMLAFSLEGIHFFRFSSTLPCELVVMQVVSSSLSILRSTCVSWSPILNFRTILSPSTLYVPSNSIFIPSCSPATFSLPSLVNSAVPPTGGPPAWALTTSHLPTINLALSAFFSSAPAKAATRQTMAPTASRCIVFMKSSRCWIDPSR